MTVVPTALKVCVGLRYLLTYPWTSQAWQEVRRASDLERSSISRESGIVRMTQIDADGTERVVEVKP